MTRREYGQECSFACALDRIGERWSMLIVRELSLGPLRFSDLARSVGGAPTDVLTKRLRDLEADGIVARRELDPPAVAIAYELTGLGRELERPMLELGRWGLNFQALGDIIGLPASSLPNALRVVLFPPPDLSMALQLHSDGQAFGLRIEEGWIDARRGLVDGADLTLSGPPAAVMAALVIGEEVEAGIEIEGDRDALESLRSLVVVPERLREEALVEFGVEPVAATARTA
ncbi:MAG TPA: winged helix-turn-helix transcriptional regulator [Solirubrobacterales bacterium]